MWTIEIDNYISISHDGCNRVTKWTFAKDGGLPLTNEFESSYQCRKCNTKYPESIMFQLGLLYLS